MVVPSPPTGSPAKTPTPHTHRKGHKKSRGGCAECKRRRVKVCSICTTSPLTLHSWLPRTRLIIQFINPLTTFDSLSPYQCDEQKPQCKACKRHDVSCIYPVRAAAKAHERLNPDADAAIPATPPASAPSTVATAASASPAPGDNTFSHPERPSGVSGPSFTTSRINVVDPSLDDNISRAPLISPDTAGAFSMGDLVLLHHWTASASGEMYQTKELHYCWQTLFPQIGFQHPFVMHGILSLSALHLAHVEEHSQFERVLEACRHYNISSQGFREAMAQMDGESVDDPSGNARSLSSDALFACAILNVIYSLAMMRHSSDRQPPTSRSRYSRALGTEIIPIIRGLQAVLDPIFTRVQSGVLQSLTSLGNWDELLPDVHTDDEHFRRIRDTWTQEAWTPSRPSDVVVYDDTLYLLRRCRLYIEQFSTMDEETLQRWGCNRGWASPLVFLCIAPDGYFVRLHQRHPPALILFAYFGALLRHLENFWYVQGWGCDIVMAVDEILGDFWESWLHWPKQVFGIS